jgi:hypothetical protein
MTAFKRLGGIAAFYFWFCSRDAQAGMTVYDLDDVVRLRLEDISFFALLLLAAALGVRFLWNSLARDFSWLPRLSFRKALSLTSLLSILMLLILIMIAGARELLTPGAWHRQGSHYRPNDAANSETRQQSLQSLRTALVQYANAHQGRFPPHDYVAEVPAKLWQAPDGAGTRYVYLGGQTLSQSNLLVACEPLTFGDERLVLLAGGKIESLKTPEIHRLMGVREHP